MPAPRQALLCHAYQRLSFLLFLPSPFPFLCSSICHAVDGRLFQMPLLPKNLEHSHIQAGR